ncbi:MAG TPA: molybdenum cofactor guanylyltransferase MobA [Rhodospirillaceae bacterium]|nr:molybdenum cofactor guanylyltransferase MobA [Rhodospirillaceae bacterium]
MSEPDEPLGEEWRVERPGAPAEASQVAGGDARRLRDQKNKVAGILLAGGLSRRMGGGDKSLLTVGGRSLMERVIERAAPQVDCLILNANGDLGRFAGFGLPVMADAVGGYAGPLAGILTGLEWLRDNRPDIPWLVSFATDTPLVPSDLVERLLAAVADGAGDLACAVAGGETQPVFGLWPVSLAGALRHALVEENLYKITAFTARYRLAHADWPGGVDGPFFNVNTAEDLARLSLVLDGGLAAEAPLSESLAVAVVIERRDSGNPWRRDSWRPLQVIPDMPESAPWRLLRKGDGWEHYLAGGQTVALHRSDLASYRYNLAGAEPRLYVAVRLAGGEVPARVVMVTAAADEAETLLESGEDLVEPVPMPEAVESWIIGFAARHPPDAPMIKRRRGA